MHSLFPYRRGFLQSLARKRAFCLPLLSPLFPVLSPLSFFCWSGEGPYTFTFAPPEHFTQWKNHHIIVPALPKRPTRSHSRLIFPFTADSLKSSSTPISTPPFQDSTHCGSSQLSQYRVGYHKESQLPLLLRRPFSIIFASKLLGVFSMLSCPLFFTGHESVSTVLLKVLYYLHPSCSFKMHLTYRLIPLLLGGPSGDLPPAAVNVMYFLCQAGPSGDSCRCHLKYHRGPDSSSVAVVMKFSHPMTRIPPLQFVPALPLLLLFPDRFQYHQLPGLPF